MTSFISFREALGMPCLEAWLRMKLEPRSLKSLMESVAMGTAHGFDPTTTLPKAAAAAALPADGVGEVTSAL